MIIYIYRLAKDIGKSSEIHKHTIIDTSIQLYIYRTQLQQISHKNRQKTARLSQDYHNKKAQKSAKTTQYKQHSTIIAIYRKQQQKNLKKS